MKHRALFIQDEKHSLVIPSSTREPNEISIQAAPRKSETGRSREWLLWENALDGQLVSTGDMLPILWTSSGKQQSYSFSLNDVVLDLALS